MVRATLRMKISPGSEPRFEQAWSEVAASVSANPANLGQTLMRDLEPGSYVITSDWTSLADFSAFERSEEQDRLTETLRRVRVSAEMLVYEIVQHVAPSSKESS
jgi:heme-degrading monooxygenase HmoA